MERKRITKDQISGPSPLITTSFTTPLRPLPIEKDTIPFTAGRFDASASVVGGPGDPRTHEQKPKTMTLIQFQSFCQALAVYRRQIQAMAAATETFVRALEELSDCVPAAHVQNTKAVQDLDFLVDSTQLIANAHQIWASSIQRELEEPMSGFVEQIMQQAKQQQEYNKQRIQQLISQLHMEEDTSYKQKKKNRRDLDSLQQSLNVRMGLADEIKRLSLENEHMFDILAQKKVEPILLNLQRAVTAEMETYETILEGMHKIEVQGKMFGHQKKDSSLSKAPTVRSVDVPTLPATEVLPVSQDPNLRFLADAFKKL
ncbi:hypothetical protein EDD86DRAFT_196300 [Gorgonomyces haynaldii]|nr:hypothetical protein EDD86DRAFT_196300 [Gorgonomyces haynaldii]